MDLQPDSVKSDRLLGAAMDLSHGIVRYEQGSGIVCTGFPGPGGRLRRQPVQWTAADKDDG